MMAFLYPFLVLLQPGILWPALQPYKPILITSAVAGIWALAMRRRSPGLLGRYFRHPAFIGLCVFFVVQVASVAYAGVQGMIEEWDFWDNYVLFVAISLLLIRDVAAARRYVWGMLAGGSVVVGYGLWAVATHSPTLPGGRAGAYGMYENHNDYTFIILTILPPAWIFLRHYRQLWIKFLRWTLMAACIAGVLLSLSRGGILVLVFDLALIVWFSGTGTRRALTLALLGIIGTAAVVYQFQARELNQQGVYSEEQAKSSRYELWNAAENMVIRHPILGVGSRRFQEFAQGYGHISHDNRGKVAHNTYLEIAADSGLSGILSFLFMIRAVARSVRPQARETRSDGLDALRRATFITLIGILFRSLLDAKATDWSFYLLVTLGVAVSGLETESSPAADAPAVPLGRQADRPAEKTSPRPAVYGRRR